MSTNVSISDNSSYNAHTKLIICFKASGRRHHSYHPSITRSASCSTQSAANIISICSSPGVSLSFCTISIVNTVGAVESVIARTFFQCVSIDMKFLFSCCLDNRILVPLTRPSSGPSTCAAVAAAAFIAKDATSAHSSSSGIYYADASAQFEETFFRTSLSRAMNHAGETLVRMVASVSPCTTISATSKHISRPNKTPTQTA